MRFADAVDNQEARTKNGMRARRGSSNSCVDLFYKIAASRGRDITGDFAAALAVNPELAVRIALWARDVRGGAGERQIFRDILLNLEKNSPELASKIMHKIPELGRWDDLLVFNREDLKGQAFSMIHDALAAGNGLCAKWMPRKGALAAELRRFLGWTPKFYRKRLVELTQVVETKMCANQWDDIEFSHVPSLAHARYKKAFNRHTTEYGKYVASLVKGVKGVKVNAGAIFPHDVLKGRIGGYSAVIWDKTELDLIQAQWEALPNYVGDSSVLALVDVSGSMTCKAGSSNTSCLEVAVSLGLYVADKNRGDFKDTFLTFSGSPDLVRLKGNINQKIQQMTSSNWGMNTDLNLAFEKILEVAKKGRVAQEDMPDTLLILSDMQFDACVEHDDTAFKMIRRKYEEAGYNLPRVVFWNLNAHDNVPVKFNKKGTALVSGFSPAILKSLLGGNLDKFTPENVMLETVMVDRYNF